MRSVHVSSKLCEFIFFGKRPNLGGQGRFGRRPDFLQDLFWNPSQDKTILMPRMKWFAKVLA